MNLPQLGISDTRGRFQAESPVASRIAYFRTINITGQSKVFKNKTTTLSRDFMLSLVSAKN